MRFIRAFAGLAMAAAVAQPAAAAVLVRTTSGFNHSIGAFYDLQDRPAAHANQTFLPTIAQFDASLGVLQSIGLSFQGTALTNAEVAGAGGANDQFFGTALTLLQVSGGGLVFGDPQAVATSAICSLAVAGSCSNTAQGIQPLSFGATLTGAAMNPYIGAGVVTYSEAMDLRVAFGHPNGSDGGAQANFAVTNSLLTVTYNYLAAPAPPIGAVPEPAAWALMITGFGLAGAMLRRRRALALAH